MIEMRLFSRRDLLNVFDGRQSHISMGHGLESSVFDWRRGHNISGGCGRRVLDGRPSHNNAEGFDPKCLMGYRVTGSWYF